MDSPKVYCAYDEMMDVVALIPNPRNPNQHPEKQIELLAKIIKNQGWRAPITISNRSGFIVRGHGRLMAAKKLGLSQVPVDRQDYANEAEEWADLIADNRISELSQNDDALLKDLLEELDTGAFDMDLTGFDADEIEKLMTQFHVDEVKEDDFDAEKAAAEIKEPVNKPGQIWKLGRHRLMCGDSTKAEDVSRLMDGKKAELVFTDPPYKIQIEGGCKGSIGKSLKTQGKEIKFIADFLPQPFLEVLPQVFNKKMNAYIFCNKELLPDYLFWAKEKGISFNVLVWKKPSAIPIGDSHRPDIEYLLLFRKNAKWNSGLKDVNYSRCLEYSRVSKSEETGNHPTVKPLGLIANEIKISCDSDDVIVDFFGGSGSTLIAAEQLNRICYMMELDPIYCDVIIQRFEQFTGQKAELVG